MSNNVRPLSATSIAAFKACPMRYRLGYVEGIRQAEVSQPLRFGTAWHTGLELLSDASLPDPLGAAIDAATAVYATVPDGVAPTDWAVEREIVANALAGYHWCYGTESDYEVVATEVAFDLPLVNPETNHSTPNFRRVGKIDKILRHRASGCLLVGEHKTTSKPIDSGSTYWDRLRKDTQSKFYILAARDLQKMEHLDTERGMPVSGLLHDVFHKPQISPKKLTQAESATFVETGEYCGQTFQVDVSCIQNKDDDSLPSIGLIEVDGFTAEVEPGKKEGTFAMRETPGMFGARLLQDITQRPEFYFARREVPFTDAELVDFQYQIWAFQKTMSEMERTGHWYENEQQCEATFRCPYTSICYNNVACCDGVTVPPGFRRLQSAVVLQTEVGAE